ncbi:TPA: hypothetical protein ACUZBG_004114, partial [Escherichia coli]
KKNRRIEAVFFSFLHSRITLAKLNALLQIQPFPALAHSSGFRTNGHRLGVELRGGFPVAQFLCLSCLLHQR